MTESARDLARKLLAGKESLPASAVARPAVAGGPRPRRGPGRQFADHPDLVASTRQLAELTALYQRSGMATPVFLARTGANDPVIRTAERELVNFSAYNYLGLAGHPLVIAGAKAALDQYGASASASRVLSGEIDLYGELEDRLAAIYDVGAALVVSSGYLTNAATIGFLVRAGDVAICDALIHGSVISGTQWGGCRRISFRHNDPDALRSVLRTSRAGFDRALVVLEGHYSMDGTVGRIPELAAIAREFDCAVLVDEAHSIGVFGRHGYGIREHYGLAGDAVDIWMGTLSKALGSSGGYLAGDPELIEGIKAAAPGVSMLTVGPPPSTVGAVLAALDVLEAEPQRLVRLWDNARTFTELATARGLNLGRSQGTPITPVIVPGQIRSGFVASKLLDHGVYAGPIIPPTVQAGTERLRFFLTSEHAEDQLISAVDLLAEFIEQAAMIPDPTSTGGQPHTLPL